MLLRTVSCDGGMRVDLSCDTCGESYEPANVARFSRRLMWAAARSDGWVEASASAASGGVLARHRCPSCALGTAVVPTATPALPGVAPVF
jgi:hypothetical protein